MYTNKKNIFLLTIFLSSTLVLSTNVFAKDRNFQIDKNTDNKVVVKETAYEFDCGFGNNVSVEGIYNKISNDYKSIEYP